MKGRSGRKIGWGKVLKTKLRCQVEEWTPKITWSPSEMRLDLRSVRSAEARFSSSPSSLNTFISSDEARSSVLELPTCGILAVMRMGGGGGDEDDEDTSTNGSLWQNGQQKKEGQVVVVI